MIYLYSYYGLLGCDTMDTNSAKDQAASIFQVEVRRIRLYMNVAWTLRPLVGTEKMESSPGHWEQLMGNCEKIPFFRTTADRKLEV
jgi:hypothetical protein